MALADSYGLFWNSENGDRKYNAESFEIWLKKFFTSGVFNGDLFVSAVSGMQVSVGTGYANVDGKVRFFDATTNLTLAVAGSTNPRIDAIVVERNDGNREITLKVVQGAYAETPVATAPVREGGIYQLVLAEIYVDAAVATITQENITDKRTDTNVCGYVTGTVEEMDFSQFAAQFQSYYQNFVDGNEADFDEWFDHIKDQLSEDAAGRLQLEIDEINNIMIPGVLQDLSDHEDVQVNSQSGVHGFRFYSDRLQYFDTFEEKWADIDVQAVTPVGDVSNVAISTDSATYIGINWKDPEDVVVDGVTLAKWAGTKLVRKVGSAPVNESDGTLLVNSTTRDDYASTAYSDTNVSEETIYYYRLFPYTETGRVTNGVYMRTSLVPEGATVTPVNDVEIWLLCAEIYGKNYTMLSQVLSDTSTLLALISDSNAVDYMVRSTSWATDICANHVAMVYIGLNNYCANVLLSNSVWREAIINSAHQSSVINTKIPSMTSNTTPSGEVFTSDTYGPTNAYKSFDGDHSGYSEFMFNIPDDFPGILGYKFTAVTDVVKIDIMLKERNNRDLKPTFKLQGSSDGVNYNDITNSLILNVLNEVVSFNIPYNQGYTYFRIYITDNNGYEVYRGYGYELQFYGRQNV